MEKDERKEKNERGTENRLFKSKCKQRDEGF